MPNSYDPLLGYKQYATEVQDRPTALGAATDAMQSGMYSGLEFAAKEAGFDSVSDWAKAKAASNLAESQKYTPTGPQRVEDIKGVGDFFDYAGNMAVSQAPILGTMLGAGAAGALVAGPVGALAGAVTSTAPMHLGEAYNRQKEMGVDDPNKVWGAAGFNTALDVVPVSTFINTARKLGGGTFAKAVARGSVAEGSTEAIQGGVVDYAASIAPSLEREYVMNRVNEAVAGAMLGGGMTGAGHAIGSVADLPGAAYDTIRDADFDPMQGLKKVTGYKEAEHSPFQTSQDNKKRVAQSMDLGIEQIRNQLYNNGFIYPKQKTWLNKNYSKEEIDTILNIYSENTETAQIDESTLNDLERIAYDIYSKDLEPSRMANLMEDLSGREQNYIYNAINTFRTKDEIQTKENFKRDEQQRKDALEQAEVYDKAVVQEDVEPYLDVETQEQQFKDVKDTDSGETKETPDAYVDKDAGFTVQNMRIGKLNNKGEKWDGDADYLLNVEAAKPYRTKTHKKDFISSQELLDQYNTSRKRQYRLQSLRAGIEQDVRKDMSKQSVTDSAPEQLDTTINIRDKNDELVELNIVDPLNAKKILQLNKKNTNETKVAKASRLRNIQKLIMEDSLLKAPVTVEERIAARNKEVAADIMATRRNQQSDFYNKQLEIYDEGRNPEGILDLYDSIESRQQSGAVRTGNQEFDYEDRQRIEVPYVENKKNPKKDTTKISQGFLPLKPNEKGEYKRLNMIKAVKARKQELEYEKDNSDLSDREITVEAVKSVLTEYLDKVNLDDKHINVERKARTEVIPRFKESPKLRSIYKIIKRVQNGDSMITKLPGRDVNGKKVELDIMTELDRTKGDTQATAKNLFYKLNLTSIMKNKKFSSTIADTAEETKQIVDEVKMENMLAEVGVSAKFVESLIEDSKSIYQVTPAEEHLAITDNEKLKAKKESTIIQLGNLDKQLKTAEDNKNKKWKLRDWEQIKYVTKDEDGNWITERDYTRLISDEEYKDPAILAERKKFFAEYPELEQELKDRNEWEASKKYRQDVNNNIKHLKVQIHKKELELEDKKRAEDAAMNAQAEETDTKAEQFDKGLFDREDLEEIQSAEEGIEGTSEFIDPNSNEQLRVKLDMAKRHLELLDSKNVDKKLLAYRKAKRKIQVLENKLSPVSKDEMYNTSAKDIAKAAQKEDTMRKLAQEYIEPVEEVRPEFKPLPKLTKEEISAAKDAELEKTGRIRREQTAAIKKLRLEKDKKDKAAKLIEDEEIAQHAIFMATDKDKPEIKSEVKPKVELTLEKAKQKVLELSKAFGVAKKSKNKDTEAEALKSLNDAKAERDKLIDAEKTVGMSTSLDLDSSNTTWQRFVVNNNLKDSIKSLHDEVSDRATKHILKRVHSLLNSTDKLKLFSELTEEQKINNNIVDGRIGFYTPYDNMAAVDDTSGRLGSRVIMHEAIHAVTYNALESYSQGKPITKRIETFGKKIESIQAAMTDFLAANPGVSEFAKDFDYSTSSVHEFMAVALSDSKVMSVLKQIPFRRQTLANKFANSIREFLGLSNRDQNALNAMLDVSGEVFNEINYLNKFGKEFKLGDRTPGVPVDIESRFGPAMAKQVSPEINILNKKLDSLGVELRSLMHAKKLDMPFDEFKVKLDTINTQKEVINNQIKKARDEAEIKPETKSETKPETKSETKPETKSKTPEFDKLPSYTTGQKTMTYAGIGSRQTPVAIIKEMTKLATMLESKGYTLQSGKAEGADTAFEDGVRNKDNKSIFEMDKATDITRQIAKEIHPVPNKLYSKGLDLMARNTNQVFGGNLDTPVDFVLTWTPDGAVSSNQRTIKTGGTGQAIDMASRKSIPVINMATDTWRKDLKIALSITKTETKPEVAKQEKKKIDKMIEHKEQYPDGVPTALKDKKVTKNGRIPHNYPIVSKLGRVVRDDVPQVKFIKDLIANGHRTATTRSMGTMLPVGSEFVVPGVEGKYRVTRIQKVGSDAESWSKLEGWAPEAFDKFGYQVTPKSWQMVFERIDKPTKPKPKLKLKTKSTQKEKTDKIPFDDVEYAKQKTDHKAGLSQSPFTQKFGEVYKNPVTTKQTQVQANAYLKDLGINTKIVDGQEALKLANDLGIEDAEFGMKSGSLHGFAGVKPNVDGTYNVYINPSIQGNLRNEILEHELGHVVMYGSTLNSNSKEANAVLKEFTSWLNKQGKSTNLVTDLIKSKKSPQAALLYMQRIGKGQQVKGLSKDVKTYMLSFDEWFADQAGKALARKTIPRTIVQKFFGKLIQTLKKVFGVDDKVETYIDRLRAEHQVRTPGKLTPKLVALSNSFNTDMSNSSGWTKAKDTLLNVLGDKDFNLRRLAGGNIDAFNELADLMFKPRGKTTTDNSYWHNKLLYLAKYDTQATNIMRGATKEVQTKVMQELYNENLPNSSALQRTVKIRGLLKDLKDYMEAEGIKVPTRKNYFPNIVDQEYTAEHHDEFVAMMERYPDAMDGIAKKWNKDTKSRARYKHETVNPDDLLVAADIPQLLYENIVRGDLMDEAVSEGQQTPHVRFLKHRVIDFLEGVDKAIWKDSYLQHSVTDATSTYIMQVVKRVEYAKRFGKLDAKERSNYIARKQLEGGKLIYTEDELNNFENEATWTNKLEVLLDKARDEGATDSEIQHARDYVAAEMGTHGRNTARWLNEKLGLPMPQSHAPINTNLQRATSTVMSAANVWVLGLSTITSLLDPIGIAVRSGSMTQALSSMVQGIKASVGKDRNELEIMAEAVGSISDIATKEALAHGYNMVNMTPTIKNINDKFFHIIGLEQWTKTTRLMAVDAAQGFIKRHSKNPNKNSERFLKELGLQGGDVKYGNNGKVKVLTYEEYQKASESEQARDDRVKSAIAEFVDTSILRPSPSQRPAWASDPHFALLFHLKSFMYSFQKTILNPLWHEAKQGNYAPLVAVAMYLPAGIAVGLIKDLFKTFGDDEEDWTPDYKENWGVGNYMLDGVEKSGLTGITQPIFDIHRSQQYGGTWVGGLFGPTLEPWDTFNGLPVPLNYTWNNLTN